MHQANITHVCAPQLQADDKAETDQLRQDSWGRVAAVAPALVSGLNVNATSFVPGSALTSAGEKRLIP